MKSLAEPQFGNYQMLGPDGQLMFRCNRRKALWYEKRGLAREVSHHPPVFQLTFEPNGNGHNDPYLLSPKENICVVCGIDTDLTKHHIVPGCYRKLFPHGMDFCMSYNVLPICVEHHNAYEVHVQDHKNTLAEIYRVPKIGISEEQTNRVRIVKLANTLVNRETEIPDHVYQELLTELQSLVGDTQITSSDLRRLSRGSRSISAEVNHASALVGKLKDYESIEDFIILWRNHFVKYAKPQFLHEAWDTEKRFFDFRQKERLG